MHVELQRVTESLERIPVLFMLGALLLALTIGPLAVNPAAAATVSRITAVERDRNVITVGTEQLRLTAESRLSEVGEAMDRPAVITYQSLSVGDYVIVERDGDVIKSLQRVDPASIDLPAAIPLPVQPGRDQ
jgi:hypothetical protein